MPSSPANRRSNAAAAAAARMESLEGRRLMAAAPLGVESVPMTWDGEVHQAKPGGWVAGFEQMNGRAQEQLAAVNAKLAATGKAVRATRQLGADGLFQLEAAAGEQGAELRRAVGRLPGFRFLEPDFVLSASATPANDPYYTGGQLWGLNNTGQSGGRADADIDAPEAWDLARGNGSVVVGVIDSGVDYNHPDLRANIWTNPGEVAGDNVDNDGNGYTDDVRGWDFYNRDNTPSDDNGHGTHVAGTIAGAGNNAAGVTGVNWNAKVVPIKFMAPDGTGYLSDAVAAINYATDLKLRGVNLRVTNNSWGGGPYSQTMYDAIQRHNNAGVLFVAAAGNYGDDNDALASYPNNYNLPNVVAVAATDHADALPAFSNYGATQVDLAAPGVNILSTVPGGGYAYMSGTSMAAPHVAGAAALAWAYSPTATVSGVRSALLNGADRVSTLTGKVATGGRLNAFNTVRRVGFGVASTSPAAGATVTSRGTSFAVNFTNPYASSSVQASDFKVNGISATSVTFTDADTATFGFSTTPVTSASGTQRMTIAAGAISGTSGTQTGSWSGNFNYAAPGTPLAPASLTARAVSRSQISLAWQDRSTNESGFRIERSSDGGKTYTQIATVGANATGYTAGSLSANLTYYFRVRAYNSAGTSAYSNVASAKTFA